MIKYEVIMYWSEEDGCYLAEVPELPGCMADGATLQEALINVEQARGVAGDGSRTRQDHSRTEGPFDLRVTSA